jgi:hypothetical protein
MFFLAFSLFSNIALSQEHGMVIRKDSIFSSMWILEERGNYRSMASLLREDGSKLQGPFDIYSADMVNPGSEERAIISKMTTSLLSRYITDGIDRFGLNYVITPDGNVAEVYFTFSPSRPNITDAELIYWRSLSDEIKRVVKFTIPERARGLRFYNMGGSIIISRLLNPGQAKPATRSHREQLHVPPVVMTREELEEKRARDRELKKKIEELSKDKDLIKRMKIK